MAPRDVILVVFPDLQGLDLIGPAEVFAAANQEVGQPAYRIRLAAVAAGPAPHHQRGHRHGRRGHRRRAPARSTRSWSSAATAPTAPWPTRTSSSHVARLARDARRVTSVCSGAFVLAQAGLLDGRRATTHWRVCDLLARAFPAVHVDPDPIYVRDGNVFTSAGVTAGMDLALALVEDDLGRDVALAIARRMVLFLRRPANQSQFSAPLQAQAAERDGIREAQHLVTEHPEGDCSVAALARVALMSERNFARCFTAEVGVTPARYVERVRVETARRLLEDTDDGVEAIAAAAGFGTAETMRRTFLRLLRTNPTEYRRRFRAA